MKLKKYKYGFTLAELLMSICVLSIILAAIATLSYALGNASDMADNTSDIQSRVRFTTMRLGGLIRMSKLICYNFGTSAVIWQADYNGNSKIEPNEIVYLESGNSNNYLKMVSFTPAAAVASYQITLDAIGNGTARTWLGANCQSNYITFINDCNYVNFTTDRTGPPWTFSKKLNITFGVNNNGTVEHYQISEYLRGQAGYLLDASGNIISSDDDM